MTLALMAVRQEVNNFESSEVVQELEFTMNLALYGPILNYGCEVWRCCQAEQIERFCKQLLGVKTLTQNDFIYGEF